jgi:hypothetical protein
MRNRADADARERNKRVVKTGAVGRRRSSDGNFWYVCHGQNAKSSKFLKSFVTP